MARLHLTVEGPTERQFAVSLLRQHLANCGVYVGRIELAAHARKKREVHRGGLQRYLPFRNDVVRRLKEDGSRDVFLSTMIDLYALPTIFPEPMSSRASKTPTDAWRAMERALAADIGDPRFMPYIQLHEFEAVLLADAGKIATYYDRMFARAEQLQHSGWHCSFARTDRRWPAYRSLEANRLVDSCVCRRKNRRPVRSNRRRNWTADDPREMSPFRRLAPKARNARPESTVNCSLLCQRMHPSLTDDLRDAIRAICLRYPTKQAATLPALHLVNDRLGYVPPQAVVEIAELLDLAPAQVQDTLSFYGFFKQDKPQGRYRVWVCRSIVCAACGGEELLSYLVREAGHPAGRNHAPTAA